MARLSICLMGPLQVSLDDQPLDHFETNKARALLAFLAAESSRPHTREMLAELFWPDSPPARAFPNLRHTLTRLRKTIGAAAADPSFLLVSRDTIQLNQEADVSVDLDRLTALLDSERRDMAACREAVRLYQGPFLDGFTLDGSPDFEAWIVATREEIAQHLSQALAYLVRTCFQSGQIEQAIDWTQQQLALEPWNEEVHRQLIWLLAQAGRRSAALRQYDQCRRMLAEQFAAEPEAATLELAEGIRHGTENLDGVLGQDGQPLGFSGFERDRDTSVKLPSMPGTILGRETELAQIETSLADPACRLLTLVGVGGVGKTRLAVEAAARNAGAFDHGTCFVPLAAVMEGDLLVNEILQALDAQNLTAADPVRQLHHYLREREMLLVLDNFEQLVESGTLLVSLLDIAPRIKLLVTSRERLNLTIEWLMPLDGLALPIDTVASVIGGSVDGQAWGEYAAIQLFRQSVRRIQPAFEIDNDNKSLIVDICRLLGGLPLAIELTAVWARLLSLPDIKTELAGGIDLLSTTQRDVQARHRSMRAVFDRSWRLLGPNRRSLLRQLSVFRGGCTREAVEAVTGASLVELSSLLDSSWLRVGETGRYEMHELVRQYCEERLERGENEADVSTEQVRRRHGVYYGDLMERLSHEINFKVEPIREIVAEFGNLQAAWRWAVETEQMDVALNAVIMVRFYSQMSGRQRFCVQLCETYADQLRLLTQRLRCEPARAQGPGIVLAWVEQIMAALCLELGLLERAEDYIDDVRTTISTLEPDERCDELLLIAEFRSAVADAFGGRSARANRAFRKLRRRFETSSCDFTLMGRDVGLIYWLSEVHWSLADTSLRVGRYEDALKGYSASYDLRAQIGEQRFSAQMTAMLAQFCWIVGEAGHGEKLALMALRHSSSLGDQIAIGHACQALGQCQTALGKNEPARRRLETSLEVGRRSGVLKLTMGSLVHLGRLALAEGDVGRAEACCEEAMDALNNHETAYADDVASVLLVRGWAALARQDHTAAQRFFLDTMRYRGRAAWEAMDALAGLAEVEWRTGDQDRATRMFAIVLHSPATAHVTRRYVTQSIESIDIVLPATVPVSAQVVSYAKQLDDLLAKFHIKSEMGVFNMS